MHIVLFALGVVTAIAGFLAILYGIPVNEFSFGNTLIRSEERRVGKECRL